MALTGKTDSASCAVVPLTGKTDLVAQDVPLLNIFPVSGWFFPNSFVA